ncbi:signal recognition particle receptor subunit alpha [Thermococcus sp. JCM 11816]|uniref:signal recognition particle receptor subunit alpha n=1 Tax=Thermococcus sp. (strain JCM 11816 / KS-1) TaxID=1295125 RepID=UPI003465ABC2
MALEKLGQALNSALKKLARSSTVDEATIKEIVRDIQRALLQADVNVKLVLQLTKQIQKRALEEEPPRRGGQQEGAHNKDRVRRTNQVSRNRSKAP